MSYVVAFFYWLLTLTGAPVQPCAIAQSVNGQDCAATAAPPPTAPPPASPPTENKSKPPRNVVLAPQISNGL